LQQNLSTLQGQLERLGLACYGHPGDGGVDAAVHDDAELVESSPLTDADLDLPAERRHEHDLGFMTTVDGMRLVFVVSTAPTGARAYEPPREF